LDGKNIQSIEVYPTTALSPVGVVVDTNNTDTPLDAGASANANAGESFSSVVDSASLSWDSPTPTSGRNSNSGVLLPAFPPARDYGFRSGLHPRRAGTRIPVEAAVARGRCGSS